MLVLGRAVGWVHTSRIPLAAKMVEYLGDKTGAWMTTITYDSATITPETLKQYDAIFLASTTGEFLDDPNDKAATGPLAARALLDFVKGGKGLAADPRRYRQLPFQSPYADRHVARVQRNDRRVLQISLELASTP